MVKVGCAYHVVSTTAGTELNSCSTKKKTKWNTRELNSRELSLQEGKKLKSHGIWKKITNCTEPTDSCGVF